MGRNNKGQFIKGHLAPPTAFQKGFIPWNKGLDCSDVRVRKNIEKSSETRRKLIKEGKLVYYKNGFTTNCFVCGKEFYSTLSKNQKYCSVNCCFIDKKGKPSPRKGSGDIFLKCKECGKQFKTLKSYHSKFCSFSCFSINTTGKNNPRWSRIETQCNFCHAKIYIKQCEKKLFNLHYCSGNCRKNDAKNGNLKNLLVAKGKKRWENPKFFEKNMKALLVRPTSLEKDMMKIIQRYNLPYRYTGDGSFLIGFKNPDFVNINGEKKLIEVGNVYHHKGDYIEKRREHFAQYGWESFIFIQDKLNEEEILKTLGIKEEK